MKQSNPIWKYMYASEDAARRSTPAHRVSRASDASCNPQRSTADEAALALSLSLLSDHAEGRERGDGRQALQRRRRQLGQSEPRGVAAVAAQRVADLVQDPAQRED